MEKLIVSIMRTRRYGPVTDFNSIFSQPVNAGYMVSYSAKELNKLFYINKFILIKENPQTILKHLMFGYYNEIYPINVIEDFNNYFQVDLTNIANLNLTYIVNKYYEEIENIFGDKLIVVDLNKHDSSFINFLNSPDYYTLCEKLTDWAAYLHSLNPPDEFKNWIVKPSEILGFAENLKSDVINKKVNFIYDYFIKSQYYGVPEIDTYAMNAQDYFSPNKEPITPLQNFLKEMKDFSKNIATMLNRPEFLID